MIKSLNHVYREALVPYTTTQMFELVHHIPDYPKFLPWCKAAHIQSQTENTIIATLLLSKGGIHKTFTTKNTSIPTKRIDIDLVDGPFKHLTGHWRFEATPDGCLVAIDLEFEFSSRIIAILFGPVFHEITHLLVNAFTTEAKRRYGKISN